jgi:uncharacterized 2Fe-2S/4Fe-4S cluster protein (DUF4445 family)
MRIKYSVENGVEGPTGDVRKALNSLALKCAEEAKKSMDSIYMVTVVGNTCMHHLFYGYLPCFPCLLHPTHSGYDRPGSR